MKTGGNVVLVPVEDIDWIDADGDYVRIHVAKVSHTVRETMHHLETELDPARFVRIHRSTIVNLARVKELQPFYRPGEFVAVLHDGTRLKLSAWVPGHSGSPSGPTVVDFRRPRLTVGRCVRAAHRACISILLRRL